MNLPLLLATRDCKDKNRDQQYRRSGNGTFRPTCGIFLRRTPAKLFSLRRRPARLEPVAVYEVPSAEPTTRDDSRRTCRAHSGAAFMFGFIRTRKVISSRSCASVPEA